MKLDFNPHLSPKVLKTVQEAKHWPHLLLPPKAFTLANTKPKAMTTLLRIKLSELNPELLQVWKQQYGEAQLEIVVDIPTETSFGEEDFWAIIARFDWSQSDNDALVIEPAVAALAARPLADIRQFEELLAQKLWLLDTPAHAKASMAEEDSDSDYLSVDGFLYDRCCVVANGRAFYEQVLADPDQFPAGYSFETLLSLTSYAYERRTGTEYIPTFTKLSYETYSNREAWDRQD
jgi:hypothetical protein